MKTKNYFKIIATTLASAIGYNIIYIILSLSYRIMFEGSDTAFGIESRGERIFYLLMLIIILASSFTIFGVILPKLSGDFKNHTKDTTLAVFVISLIAHLLTLVIYYYPIGLINFITIEYQDYFIISILVLTIISNTIGAYFGCKKVMRVTN